jgi:predicted nuclease of predicted toxin-antitoxin system
MKLRIDMNLSPKWVDRLTEAGFETAHWSSLGSRRASDLAITQYAGSHDWVVLTHDLDFGAILAVTHGEKPSVIQIRSGDVSPETIDPQVFLAIRDTSAELTAGALMTIDPERMRIRLLPLPARP